MSRSADETVRRHRHTERRHMIRVKDALAAGLEGDAPEEFLLACTDYLAYIIGRFRMQARRNLEGLKPRVEAADDEEGRRVMADIEATMERTGQALDVLTRAAAGRARPGGSEAFRAAARGFVDFYASVLAARKDPAQDIIARHFDSEEYWTLTDDVTPESVATERTLYARVVALAPEGMAPPADD